MAAGLPIEPLEFLRELFGILRKGGVQRIVRSAGATSIAASVVVPVLRTAGFFFNRLLGAKELSPAERLKIGVTFGFPAGINPFLFSFLSGFAYESGEDVTSGWLSAFGELLFKDAPGVEGELEKAIKSGATKDFRGVMDALATFYAEELKISDAAAFFKGIGGAAADFESLTGIAIPIAHLASGVIWLDRAIRGRFDPPPFIDVPVTEEARARTERGFEEDVEKAGRAVRRPPPVIPPKIEKELPGAIKRVTMRFLREPSATLFKIVETVSQGVKDKLRRLVLGRLG